MCTCVIERVQLSADTRNTYLGPSYVEDAHGSIFYII